MLEQVKIQGQTLGKGLHNYLAQKEGLARSTGTANTQQLAADSAGKKSGGSENFDQLRGILDPDDQRIERLHRENMNHLERSVGDLSKRMGLAIDQFYSRSIDAIRDVKGKTLMHRDPYIP